jgi:hypothetical protein
VLLFVIAATYFVLVELHRPGGTPNYDVYIYLIPNKIYAAWSVWHGGKGLLWNPYQGCGAPFFANPAMGLLYPPNLLFLVLDPNVALHGVLIINMVLGAIGMLLLGRELGLHPVAALTGALAFELGDAMATLTGWSAMHSGPWTWLPWALCCCERLLRAPSRTGVIGLAAVLALGVLPGWVLISALTFQVLALRVVWEVITRWPERPWRPVGAVLAGLALAPAIAAAQLVPAAALARESFRSTLELGSLAYGALETDVRASISARVPPVPFTATLVTLAALAPFASTRRRLLAFYLGTGALYGILALGTTTPLLALYLKLPPGATTLRYPHRLFWLTSFSLVVLAALCADGLLDRDRSRRARSVCALVVVTAVAGLAWYVPGGLRRVEIVSLLALIAAVLAVTVRPGLALPAAWILVGAVVLNVVAVPLRYVGRLLPSAQGLTRHARTFDDLRARMTPQDRVFIIPSVASLTDLGLAQKTASIVRIREIYDYEPLLGHRLTDYNSAMWHGIPVRSVEQVTTKPNIVAPYRRRLLDLAAIRYVIAPPSTRIADWGLDLRPLPQVDPGITVHENDGALPRARYVPRVEVVHDADALLRRLAFGDDDLARVALVEQPPPSGFVGAAGPLRDGAVRVVRDDPEHIVLDVDAPVRGFLFLADQHAPGWSATVNGAPTPIVRANFAFRLIEVPQGTSRVELRYRPASVPIGAAISIVTLVGVGLVLLRGRRG